MAATGNVAIGAQVWVEDPGLAWAEAEVVEINDKTVKVRTTKGNEITTSMSSVHAKDPDAQPGGVDDMTKLAYLHEPGVLYNLASRYELDEIYTYTGNILIAINPFVKLPHLYNSHMMEQYRGAPLGELSPHVFAVADTSYRAMITEKKSQSILVSGESGAGKTETTKLIMQYLAYMGGRANTDGRTVEQQVLESNPLLEAFGNAKTVRNDNSSRFGKFVEIQFDRSGRISGAAVRTYLLERSRVVQIADPERNYHCFYQLCASPEDCERYKLGDPRNFHYLNQSDCFELNGVSNGREYVKTRRAMDVVGISPDEQEAIFRVVASVLHLGNIDFVAGSDTDSSKLKDEKSQFHLEAAAELLQCESKGLLDSLCTRVLVTRDGNITMTLNMDQATVNRDTLAKTIYSRLFDWLVEKVNRSIGQDPDSPFLVGVLDIYGFESFKFNSFEQFCINLANEKLQQHFNQHVFKMEQDEYTKEAINWSYIEFVDNQDVLDLIEKKSGIIALLDEACMFPKSTNETFATKLFQQYRNHKRLSKPKLGRTDFTINHYAGDVTYQTELFLDKNKDYVVAEHQSLLGSSNCPFVASLFPKSADDGSKSSYKFSSIGTRFKQQLGALMETLNTTEPHYIRCVKPNMLNKPGRFENQNVIQQLRCGGVLEAIRISCAGYPTRRTFYEFLDRFGMLAPEVLEGNYDEKMAAETLLKQMDLKNYQLGQTKVFLRSGQMAELDAKRAEMLNNAAKKIQRRVRTFLARRHLIALRKAVVTIQKYWRGSLARKQYTRLRQEAAAICIQKNVRMWLARKKFLEIKDAAVKIQAGYRGMAARKEYRLRRQTKAATFIQARWRGYKARSQYKKCRKSAIKIQCAWRSKVARTELRKLKQAAKETGALQEAKTKLEKRCEELTWRLQLEKRMRTDMEEAKNHEITKLQAALQEQLTQAQKANSQLTKELEDNKLALGQAAQVIKEVPPVEVFDAKVEKLTKENEKLQALLKALDTRASEAETNFSQAKSESEERLKRAEQAEAKTTETQEALQRLEEKLANMESENQVLRQQTLVLSPTKGLSNRFKSTVFQRTPDNGYLANNDHRETRSVPESPNTAQIEREHTEAEQRRQKLLIDRQQENQDSLLQCVMQDVGFNNDRPIAACILYKSLLQWRSFEAERTNVFDRIIQTIGTAIESQDNNDVLAYWLSNTSTLLFLLQRTLKASGAAGGAPQRRRSNSVTLFGRMTQGYQGFRASPAPGAVSFGNGGIMGGLDMSRQVEAKYPALLFKQQLTAYVEKIYGMVRDNLKKEISPLLGLCIQAPRTSRASLGKVSRSPSSSVTAQQTLSSHWHTIISSLSSLLSTMRANHVPPFLVRKLFTQIFSFINVQLFNSLLLRRECCSFSNGEYVKAGLAELEHWIYEAGDEYAGASWDELKYIRQAVGFLVIHQKPKKSLDEITHDLCPVLSVQQLYRISTMYWDDKYGTHSVSPEVIANMRVLMTEDSNSAVSNSFLLDDDSSIPFSVDDISKSMPEVDMAEVEPPPLLKDNPAFHFLMPHPDP